MMKTRLTKYIGTVSAVLAILLLSPIGAQAQEEKTAGEEPEKKKVDKPIRSPWAAGMLIETQTDLVWAPKTLEMVMQHRFGNLNADNGFDLAGIYGASNIRIGFNYGIFKNAQIGVGTEKNMRIQDLNWKYKILTQTRSGSMPIALTYYGNVEMSLNPQSQFGEDYKFAHRISYFNQLIVSRKFSRKFTLQATATYSHFNQIDTKVYPNMKHDNFGYGIAGRYKIGSTTSIIFEYDQALTTPGAKKWLKEDPSNNLSSDEVGLRNVSLGVEFATSAHAFHIFVTTYRGISYQQNMVYNTNYFSEGDILIGFNITRNWNL